MEIEFNLKSVRFFGRHCMILCQNQNGPCPILAIANVLILQNVIHFNFDRQVVNLHALSEIVANAFVEKGLSQGNESEARKDSKQQQLDSALNMIPSMARGLDLNVCFSSVTSFEFTEGISVFDALDIPLLHGWVLDPQDTITYSVVQRNNSYNHLMFKLVEYRSLQERIRGPPKVIESGSRTATFGLDAASLPAGSSEKESCVTVVDSLDSIRNIKVDNNSAAASSIFEGMAPIEVPVMKLLETASGPDKMSSASSSSCGGGRRPTVSQDLSTEDQQLLREGRIIESFLASTASQLTHLGLMALHQHISEEQFAVFFRNNHFSTMFRYQGNLYLLVTDLGYQRETSVIWERLDGIDGDTEYVDSGFVRHRQFDQSMFYVPSKGLESSLSGRQGTVALPRNVTHVSPPSTGTVIEKSEYLADMDEDMRMAMRLQEAEHEHAQSKSISSSITSLWKPKTTSSSSDAKAMQQRAFDQVSQNKRNVSKSQRGKNERADGEVKSSQPNHDDSSCQIC